MHTIYRANTGASYESVPTSDPAGAGMRRRLRMGNDAVESFIPPLVGRARATAFPWRDRKRKRARPLRDTHSRLARASIFVSICAILTSLLRASQQILIGTIPNDRTTSMIAAHSIADPRAIE